MHEPSSVALAIPRTGSQRLTDGGQAKQCITFAAWQTPEKETPKRVVIRVDGLVNNTKDADGKEGFPCGVVKVTYTIGGLNKEVLLDCLTQSALVVWANSVEVTAHKDVDRIAALALFSQLKPCSDQTVAAAISACECGDTGAADARYLNVVPVDINGQEGDRQTFVFPVPNGARLLRVLPGAKIDTVISEVDWCSLVVFTVCDPVKTGQPVIIECQTPITNESAFTVPADARFVVICCDLSSDSAKLVQSPFIEWIMAPASVTVQTM